MSEAVALSVLLFVVLVVVQLFTVIFAYPSPNSIPNQKDGERGITYLVRLAWAADKKLIGGVLGFLFTPKTDGGRDE